LLLLLLLRPLSASRFAQKTEREKEELINDAFYTIIHSTVCGVPLFLFYYRHHHHYYCDMHTLNIFFLSFFRHSLSAKERGADGRGEERGIYEAALRRIYCTFITANKYKWLWISIFSGLKRGGVVELKASQLLK
jgi:hypothetical protein